MSVSKYCDSTEDYQNIYKFLKSLKYDKTEKLFYYQFLIINFFIKTNRRGILLFHDTGFGKTFTAISIAERTNKDLVIILCPKSLVQNFVVQRKKYEKLFGTKTKKKYITINYSESKMGKLVDTKTADFFINTLFDKINNSIVIIDECHNFLNFLAKEKEVSKKLYNLFMGATKAKFIFMSATPISKSLFEIGLCFNILRGLEIFPSDSQNFDGYFHYDNKTKTLMNATIFKNRIVGLVSRFGFFYLSKEEKKHFPIVQKVKVVEHDMSKEQSMIYLTNSVGDSFLQKRRLNSMYAGPMDTDTNNPVPFERLASSLKIYGIKIYDIANSIKKSNGLVLVYSFLVRHCLLLMSQYLTYLKIPNEILLSSVSPEKKQIIINTFNKPENKFGKLCKALLVPSSSSEGLDLKNIQFVHICEPGWNMSTIKQTIGRSCRYDSHKELPPELHKIHVYIHVAIPYEKGVRIEKNVDLIILTKSLEKNNAIQGIYKILRDVCVECMIFDPNKQCHPVSMSPNKLYDVNLDKTITENKTSRKLSDNMSLIKLTKDYYYVDTGTNPIIIKQKKSKDFDIVEYGDPNYGILLKLMNTQKIQKMLSSLESKSHKSTDIYGGNPDSELDNFVSDYVYQLYDMM